MHRHEDPPKVGCWKLRLCRGAGESGHPRPVERRRRFRDPLRQTDAVLSHQHGALHHRHAVVLLQVVFRGDLLDLGHEVVVLLLVHGAAIEPGEEVEEDIRLAAVLHGVLAVGMAGDELAPADGGVDVVVERAERLRLRLHVELQLGRLDDDDAPARDGGRAGHAEEDVVVLPVLDDGVRAIGRFGGAVRQHDRDRESEEQADRLRFVRMRLEEGCFLGVCNGHASRLPAGRGRTAAARLSAREERTDKTIVAGDQRSSLRNGVSSAAGARALRETAAMATMVSTNGSIRNTWYGTAMMPLACSRSCKASIRAKRRAPSALRQGCHWPKTTSAMHTQPRPEMTPKVKALNWAMAR